MQVVNAPRRNKETLIRNVIKNHSKYSDEELIDSALLQEELGIDSIMIASIGADLNKLFSIDETIDIHGMLTINEIIAKFSQFSLTKNFLQHWDAEADSIHEYDHDPQDISQNVAGRESDYNKLTMRDFVSDNGKDIFSKVKRFSPFLKDRNDKGLFWYGMALKNNGANRVVIFDEYTGQDREFLMFASNNYLGLANDPRVIDAIVEATRRFGATHTGCRLIGGTNELHKVLEAKLAALKGREACIVFPSGYSANVGVISSLLGPNDTVITDVYNHMSIQDGCKMSGAAKRIYRHNDMASLEDVLKQASLRTGGKLIVADGVFSMHGDIANLPEMLRLAKQYNARLLIDDAHSTGVLGKNGAGTAEHFGLKNEVDIEVGTMSKALAGMGGFVVGDHDVIEYLRYYANSYVFAATIPAGVAAGLIKSLEIMEAEPERLERLWNNIRYLRAGLQAAGFDTENSESAIIPVVIKDEQKTMAMGRSVRKRGLFCQTVVFPGVAVGDARLRISVLASHTRRDLDDAIEILIDSAVENALLEKELSLSSL